MYASMGAMWEGFVKWIYSVAALSSAALVGLIIAGYIFLLAPFYRLWNELFVVATPSDWRAIVIFQVAMIMLMRRLVDSHFETPIVSTLLHPFGFAFLFVVGLYAGMCRAVGAGVRWKQRLYGKGSGVE
jgi:hypothetical protein